jgi:hypothetical protein
MVHQLHLQTLLVSEALVRFEFKAESIGESLPMSVLHSISPQGHHNRHLGLEIIDLHFGSLCDSKDIRELFVSEVPDDLGHEFVGIIDDFFNGEGVNLIEGIMDPGLVTGLPLLQHRPQIVIRLEVLLHLDDGGVVLLLLIAHQVLPIVDHLCILLSLVQSLLDVLGHLSHLLIAIRITVLLEGGG